MKKATAKFGFLLMAAAIYLLWCPSVYAQTLTEDEKLRWFMSRLPFWSLYGFGLGTIISLGWLRRVKYVPEELSIDQKVRRRFFGALLVSLLLFGASIWLDLWLIYTFETASQTALEALSEAWLSWQSFLLVGLAGLTFFIASLFWTRGTFSGRYALWPGPKRP